VDQLSFVLPAGDVDKKPVFVCRVAIVAVGGGLGYDRGKKRFYRRVEILGLLESGLDRLD